MFDSKKDPVDANQWREKYLTECELFEQKQHSQDEYIQLLQRVLSRVSLAADGRDGALDKALKNLRRLLRKAQPSKAQLSDELTTIEALVRNLDDQKEGSTDQGMTALKDLAQQLLKLKSLSKENRSALSRFHKQLSKKSADNNQYAELLTEYAGLQEKAITENLGDNSQPVSGGGLLTRLFNKPSTAPEAPAQSAPSAATEIEDGRDDLSSLAAAIEAEEIVETGDNSQENESPLPKVPDTETLPETGDNEASKGPDLEKIRVLLSNLIDKLIEDRGDKADAVELLNELDHMSNAMDLEPALNKLADFICRFVTQMQQEFENFLLSLDEQLIGINQFLKQGSSTEETWRGKNIQIDEQMRVQVNAISEEAELATDITSFKRSVQQHIFRITESMDELLEAEKCRQQEADRQMEALADQLSQMENETNVIKKRLKDEQIKATTDVLTKLPNREALNERIQMEWERFKRYKNPLCLVITDIDHFKSVNDRYGHLIGDQVLQTIAKEITDSIRETDFVARYGGEEFVILLPETDIDAAEGAMNHIREKIAQLKLKFIDENSPITLSFGVTAFTLGHTLENLFEQADKALYQAKEKGRNRVECYSKD